MTPLEVTEAILPVDPSPNQMLPSGPGVMNAGLLRLGVLEYLMVPFGVKRATLLLLERVNQNLPSSAIVIANGWVPPRIGKLLPGVAWAATLPAERASAAMPQASLKLSSFTQSILTFAQFIISVLSFLLGRSV